MIKTALILIFLLSNPHGSGRIGTDRHECDSIIDVNRRMYTAIQMLKRDTAESGKEISKVKKEKKGLAAANIILLIGFGAVSIITIATSLNNAY